MRALEAKLNHLIPETDVFEILARSRLELGLKLEAATQGNLLVGQLSLPIQICLLLRL